MENPTGSRSWFFTLVGHKVFHVKILVFIIFRYICLLLCQDQSVRSTKLTVRENLARIQFNPPLVSCTLKPTLSKHFRNDSLSSCTKWLISFLNFTVFPFGNYFLKKTLINPFHVEIEFAGRPCIHFFAESFNAKGMKRNLTTS